MAPRSKTIAPVNAPASFAAIYLKRDIKNTFFSTIITCQMIDFNYTLSDAILSNNAYLFRAANLERNPLYLRYLKPNESLLKSHENLFCALRLMNLSAT